MPDNDNVVGFTLRVAGSVPDPPPLEVPGDMPWKQVPDSVILARADALLSKYFHPSRLGGVPSGTGLENISLARMYVQLARRMARLEETERQNEHG
jgi:hypothetical protein